MRSLRWQISPGAVVLFALVYYFDSGGLVAALVPAALAHELGHIAALALCHIPVRRIRIDLSGVEIGYAGTLAGAKALFCLAAGPGAGALYALAACAAGTEYGCLTGAVSLSLSLFNLLPILPLDGGRIAAELLGEDAAERLSRLFALGLVAGGALLLVRYHSPIPLAMGLWLWICNPEKPPL